MLIFYTALIDDPDDKEKFKEIYNKYRKMMFYVAMGVLHNKSLAEEAVQDSFIKIAKNISKISDPVCSKTANFIVVIVRNTSINNLKEEHLNEKVPFSDNVCGHGLEMPDFEKMLSEKGYSGILDIIKSMDNIYGDTLKLKYIYGYSNSEISTLLDITSKNVEMRIYRGKILLKKEMEDNGYGAQ